jgi:hypothetical protein
MELSRNETNELYDYIKGLKARIAELERENAQIVELSDLIVSKADEYKARIAELEALLNET